MANLVKQLALTKLQRKIKFEEKPEVKIQVKNPRDIFTILTDDGESLRTQDIIAQKTKNTMSDLGVNRDLYSAE